MKNKQEIKIGDKTFVINLPTGEEIDKMQQENSVKGFMSDWCKLANKKDDIDNIIQNEWIEIPQVPGYKFKGLKLVDSSPLIETEETGELNLTFKIDDWIKTEL